MTIMKKYYLLATALAALVSCSSDEYVGDNSSPMSKNEQGAIRFDGGASRLTRATSNTGTVVQMLDNQIKIYGVKKTNASGSDPTTYATVFPDYILWSSTSKTTSNPDAATEAYTDSWEYVGGTSQTYGSGSDHLTAEQYIKYWDYATDEYHFVAGSPVANFTYTINSSGEIASASVTGIAGHIDPNTSGTGITTNPVYIANPVKKMKSNSSSQCEYNTDVVFNFTRQQTYVRVGIYETIPGYSISAISFYEWDYANTNWKASAEAGHHIILNSKTDDYFSGATNGTATVTYDWTTTPASITSTTYASGLTSKESWYGGALTSGVPAITSTENTIANLYGTDNDMASATGYFTVLPMASNATAQPIIIKCDYTLTSLSSNGETINVKGATAAIPAAFCKWNPNTSYTYLFKISDNTNGYTGDTSHPEGLFPITFDAVAESTSTEQGVITTVTNSPSITTYQKGSVTSTGIKYTYNSTTTEPIYFTAQDDETGNILTISNSTVAVGKVTIYKIADLDASPAPTESDLQITAPSGSPITPVLVSTATPVDSWDIPAGAAYFTPSETGYYAIQYVTAVDKTPSATAYAYKIIKVEAAGSGSARLAK